MSLETDAFAPTCPQSKPVASDRKGNSSLINEMDFDLDFGGDNSGFQTRGKKAAAKKKASQAAWWDDDNNGGEGGANGEGGDGTGDGAGGAGDGSGAGGAGGDDNGGGDGEDDDWLGLTTKKDKKKSKKKQEEEEQKKKEEEEAAAAKVTLNWADETNDALGDDDWTAGFTTAKTKDKKKKKKVSTTSRWLRTRLIQCRVMMYYRRCQTLPQLQLSKI